MVSLVSSVLVVATDEIRGRVEGVEIVLWFSGSFRLENPGVVEAEVGDLWTRMSVFLEGRTKDVQNEKVGVTETSGKGRGTLRRRREKTCRR